MKLPKKEGFYSGICILLLFLSRFFVLRLFSELLQIPQETKLFLKISGHLFLRSGFRFIICFKNLKKKNTSYQLFLHDDKENTKAVKMQFLVFGGSIPTIVVFDSFLIALKVLRSALMKRKSR